MFKLDNNFLVDLGLGSLPPAEKNKMLSHIYETLEMKVGMRLAEKMTNEQLDEFESYINSNDEQGALKWLESNFPNYKQVVAEELEKLKSEIKQVAPQIVAQAESSAQTAPPQSPAQLQPQQVQQPDPAGSPAAFSDTAAAQPQAYAPAQPNPAPAAYDPAPQYDPQQYAQSQPLQTQQPFDQSAYQSAPTAADPYAQAQQFDQQAYPSASTPAASDFDLSSAAPASGGVAQPLPPAPDPLPPAASSDFGQQVQQPQQVPPVDPGPPAQSQYDLSSGPAYPQQQPATDPYAPAQPMQQPQQQPNPAPAAYDPAPPVASDISAFDDPAGLSPSDPYAASAQPQQQFAQPDTPLQPQQQYAPNDAMPLPPAQQQPQPPAPLSSPSQRPIEPYQPPAAPNSGY